MPAWLSASAIDMFTRHLVYSFADKNLVSRAMQEMLGIVYSPVEVTDFILRSVDAVLKKKFNRSFVRNIVNGGWRQRLIGANFLGQVTSVVVGRQLLSELPCYRRLQQIIWRRSQKVARPASKTDNSLTEIIGGDASGSTIVDVPSMFVRATLYGSRK